MSTEHLLHTPLHALHLELGARMVPFAGYDMGQIRLTGADVAQALEALVPVDIIDLPVGMLSGERRIVFLKNLRAYPGG